jgi:geranylgeranyl diphosphate synthase type II
MMDLMDPIGEVRSLLASHAQQVDQLLREYLASQNRAPRKLIEAIEYSLMAGGKRLRPTLVLECARACTATGEQEQSDEGRMQNTVRELKEFRPPPSALCPELTSLAAAGAVELIHNFSLVHDDLPAMDDDDLRRGRPTCHKVFGEAMAILAGDAMVTMAFELLATRAEADLAPRLIAELASASGPVGMIGGQVLDIAGENQSLMLEQLQQIHRMKTGALLTASCRLGAIAARADEARLDSLTQFGRHLGLAFQIVDDILDVTSTPQQLGKQTNKDSQRGKNTFPSLLGLEQSRAEAVRQLHAAVDSLRPFGARADRLRALARFVVERRT